jgi:hypothetical protein
LFRGSGLLVSKEMADFYLLLALLWQLKKGDEDGKALTVK